jgi:hypothetical protein
VTGPVWNGEGKDPWLPARLEARLEVASTERDIRRVVWAELSGWLVETARAVLRGGQRPNPDAVWARVPAWREAVDLIVSGEIRKALSVAFRRVLGAAYPWDQRVRATAYLAEVRNRLVRVPDEVFSLVAHQVATGVNLGEGIPELRARIDNILSTTASERWPNRATVIARTECLPGDAPIDGALATAVYRRWYSGPMITVKTVGGRQFTGTPNHPVLTPRGWVGLGQLLDGDRLICDSRSVKATRATGNQHVEARPTPIAQIFDTAEAIGVARRERTGQPDFHGDRPEGYVDVLGSFGVLSLGRFAAIGERSIDGLLAPSELEKVTLACERAPFPRGDSIDQAPGLLSVPPWHPGRLHYPADRFEVCPVHPGQSLARFSSRVPGHKLTLWQVGPQGWTLAPVGEEAPARFGVRPDNTPLEENAPDLIRSKAGLSSDFPIAQPGEVEIDKVLSIDVREFSGHVYNLTTVNGYFVSGGVFTGNTVGALNAGRAEAFRVVAEEDPDTIYERLWLSTDDHRTRSTHEEADGQRVPLNSPFIVGGFELAFPGDPSGPPQEIIQCRCTALLVERGESVDMSNRQMRTGR